LARKLYYTLLADGTSDKVLIHILTWLLQQHRAMWIIEPQWAEVGQLLLKKSPTLTAKIQATLELYPCDLLFIHRDAERESLEKRVQEIRKAIEPLKNPPLYVCVIPVRMQEAWLLFDESAIRQAAGNPMGREPIKLPSLKDIEREPNPKEILHNLLRQASGRSPRRLKNFSLGLATKSVADEITDYSPLRSLSAFKILEQDIIAIIRHLETRKLNP